jgi:hypothetical protein
VAKKKKAAKRKSQPSAPAPALQPETPTRAREKKPKLPPTPSTAALIDATNDATHVEAKLLAAYLDPESWKLTKVELAERAGVSRPTLYRLLDSPTFLEKKKQVQLQALKGSIDRILDATVKCAVNDGPKGFNDRKLLMEMGGYYTPAHKLEVTQPVDPNDTPPEELLYLYLATNLPESEWLPGILARYQNKQLFPRKPDYTGHSHTMAQHGAPTP